MTKKSAGTYPVTSMPLSVAAVSSYLDTNVLGSTLAVMQSVDSAYRYIKNHICALDDSFTVIAATQHAGRGRLGKSFVSPEGGLYMSTLLMGRDFIENAEQITVRAAVAVRNALAELTGIDEIGIKWVNDIYLNDKKICGILAERVVRKGFCDFSVLGIGINVDTSSKAFDGELSEIAGTLAEFSTVDYSKNKLAACVLNHLEKTLFVKNKKQQGEILDQYREHSVLIGKEVLVSNGDESVHAKVLGIDDYASLYVQYDDGKTGILRSGEVSTKLVKKEDTE